MPTQNIAQNLDDVLAGMSSEQIRQWIAAAKIRAAEAKKSETKRARAAEARRLILDGRLLAHLVHAGKIDGEMIAHARGEYLDNNQDRALFGLPLLPDDKPGAKRGRGRPKKVEEQAEMIEAVGADQGQDTRPESDADQETQMPPAADQDADQPAEQKTGWKGRWF